MDPFMRPIVHVSRATRHDAPAIARLYLKAFKTSPHLPVFAPQYVGLSDEEIFRTGLALETNKVRQQIVGPNFSMKATVPTIDLQGKPVDRIIGYATWVSPDGPRKRMPWEWFFSKVYYRIRNHFKPIPLSEGIPPLLELTAEQKEYVFGEGRKWEGQKYWELILVCVDPVWQHQGVASALLKWGFRKARESNTAIYLESSPMGIPVYESKGFRIVASLPREICGVHTDTPGMIWEPRLNTKCAPLFPDEGSFWSCSTS
ncbi:hypothetical protein Clacol_000808 [Clathrus columnatus]|uniref:N-acetyltransferase domain-containing protein n=1 Tax=Clathrus columnatus TaxID=1419009 RepID=A0AAV4ZXT3_9AGAM|nr:hypothetical protein Clacol_000808 [Clathrus columnatus]